MILAHLSNFLKKKISLLFVLVFLYLPLLSQWSDNSDPVSFSEKTPHSNAIVSDQQANLTIVEENNLLRTLNNSYTIIELGLFAVLIIGAFFMNNLWRQRKTIKKQNQELAQANATKNQFFSIIAHDLRGPVIAFQNILNRVDYLNQNGRAGDIDRMLKQVDLAATNLNALLDNLLNWSLIEENTFPYQPTNINLKDLSNENFQLYQPLAESKGVRLKQHIFSNHMVFADKNSLATILRNLVSNAIKFSNYGDEVIISAKAKGDKILLKVEDTGKGMSPEIQKRIFQLGDQKIESGISDEGGTGLGLVLCKKFVELNKGELDVETQLGKGTLFSITLPKA